MKKIMKIYTIALVLTLSVLTSGCATVCRGRIKAQKEGGPLYPATEADAKAFISGEPRVMPFAVLDLPFSLVFDTICLPYDLLMMEKYYDDERDSAGN
jgi:uncharacterized protein YceK